VVEKAATTLTTRNGADVMLTRHQSRSGRAPALMVPFAMVVHEELGQRTTKVRLIKRNHVIEAFSLN
jgi:hypothetical protein